MSDYVIETRGLTKNMGRKPVCPTFPSMCARGAFMACWAATAPEKQRPCGCFWD